jgi:hypothetical protein
MSQPKPSTSAPVPALADRVRVYRENRARFPAAELRRFAGQWVAFSADGSRILDGAADYEELERRLAEAERDPQEVVFEHVPETDTLLGGSELS